MFEDLYRPKAKSDLTKTENSWINNGETNLQQLHVYTSSCEYE